MATTQADLENAGMASTHVVLANGQVALLVSGGGGGVIDSEGNVFNPDSLPYVLTFNAGTGLIETDVRTDGVDTWTMTFDHTATTISASEWVKS